MRILIFFLLLLSQWITVFPLKNGMGVAVQKLYVSNDGSTKASNK